MKESRMISVISLLFIMVVTICYILFFEYIDSNQLLSSILMNICCGLFVGLITCIIQYIHARSKIKYDIYGYYFDIYRTYYYANNKPFLFHYNSLSVLWKIKDLNPKILESLDNYHGVFKKYDKLYYKLNPRIKVDDSFRFKTLSKSIFQLFNKRTFSSLLDPLMKDVVKILNDIDSKRFKKDNEEMIRIFNKMNN